LGASDSVMYLILGQLSSSQLPTVGRQEQKEQSRRLRKSRTPMKMTMICHHSRRTQTEIERLTCSLIQKVILILKLLETIIAMDAVISMYDPNHQGNPVTVFRTMMYPGHEALVS
jgi:hypothetical protein